MESITKIINEWDPIDFFPMAPKDEYMNEIRKIHEYIYSNENISVGQLAQKINKIFVETFGSDVYEEDMDKCKVVAEKILHT